MFTAKTTPERGDPPGEGKTLRGIRNSDTGDPGSNPGSPDMGGRVFSIIHVKKSSLCIMIKKISANLPDFLKQQ